MTPSLACTGSSARWCPVCGDCACGPRYEGDGADGERTLDDAGCPLHGASSTHARDTAPDLAAKVLALAEALATAERDRDAARDAWATLAAAVRAEREARMRYALAPKGTDARAEANDAAHDACSRLVALLSAAPTPTTVPAPLVRAYLAAEETMRLVAADDHRRDTYHEWAKRHGAAMDAVDAARAALVAGVARCAP